jgi:flagellar hook-length control protein FliK
MGATTIPSSPSKGDAAGLTAYSQRTAYRGPVLIDAGGVVAAEAALQEQDPVSGQIGDVGETRPLRTRKDDDQATLPNEAGLGGLPWLPQQQAIGSAMPVSDGAPAPQVSSSQEGDRGSSASPVDAAPLSGLPVQGNASAFSSSAEGGASQVAPSHPDQGRAIASATKGTDMQPTLPRQGGDSLMVGAQGGATASPGLPRQAGKAGLPMALSAGASPAQIRHEQVPVALSGQSSVPLAGNGGLPAAPPHAGNALPPSTVGQNAATASAQVIASSAVAADPVTATEERSDDKSVPADGTVASPTAAAISALAPPELLAPPPPADAPAMAVQAGLAPSPNASVVVLPGTGPSQAAAGRSASASGADRPASSQRETVSVEAFDELASGSTATSDDLASADLAPVPAAPFGPLPAVHIHAPAPEPAGALPQPQAAPVPLGAVPMTIGLRSLAGSNRFEISLDPKDLGRIDVNLDIDKDSGTVTAHLTVDRPETLALLQRDVGTLQQALSQAGFDAGEAAINLSLRSDTGSNGGSGAERDGGGGREGRPGTPGSDLKDPRLSHDAVPLRMLSGLGGIDIRI